MKIKYAAVKPMVLDSKIGYDDVGESTGVDMHAHEVHEMVLPADQIGSFRIKGKVADLGQHKVDQVKGSTKLTAGDVPNKEKGHKQVKLGVDVAAHGWYASEAAVHGWIPWQNPTADNMIVKESLKRESSPTESNSTIDGLKRESSFTGMIEKGLLKRESSCVGMKEQHISMSIASADGKCYNSAIIRGVSKLSDTEEINVMSPMFAWLSYAGRYCCVDGTTASQQLFEMAKVRGLALVQTEERHSADNQVRVEDNRHRVGIGSQVATIMDWMAPDLCSRCVAMKLGLKGIHEDTNGMCVTCKMGQRSVHLESASDIDECRLTMCNHPNEIFDEIVEKCGDVWIVGESQCLRDTAAHDDVVTGDEDRARLSTKAAVSCHTIVARVLYARLPITE